MAMKKSLILIAALASVAVAGSESLEDAFKNGKFSGDITAWSESKNQPTTPTPPISWAL